MMQLNLSQVDYLQVILNIILAFCVLEKLVISKLYK